jgi:hypothetical protein
MRSRTCLVAVIPFLIGATAHAQLRPDSAGRQAAPIDQRAFLDLAAGIGSGLIAVVLPTLVALDGRGASFRFPVALTLAAGGALALTTDREVDDAVPDLDPSIPDFGVSILTRAIDLDSYFPGNATSFRGFMYGAEGRIAWYRLSLVASYAQGSLERANVEFTGRQFVDAAVNLGGSPLPGLRLGVGPRAFAYSNGEPAGPGLLRIAITRERANGIRRWLRLDLHGRYETTLVSPIVTSFAALHYSPVASVNNGEVFEHGRGAEVGLQVRIGDPPLTARFAYDIDEMRLGRPGRRETLERVTFALGVALGGARPAFAR